MRIMQTTPFRHSSQQLGAIIVLLLASTCASAHQGHHHGQGAQDGAASSTSDVHAPPIFVASTAKPFDALMDDAMAVMDDGMLSAPMNGEANHDFITMMQPHHQGAVDMAKAVLLYTTDPEFRNFALGFFTEQQNEIKVMEAWLQHHPDGPGK
jgi:hypothetical protein